MSTKKIFLASVVVILDVVLSGILAVILPILIAAGLAFFFGIEDGLFTDNVAVGVLVTLVCCGTGCLLAIVAIIYYLISSAHQDNTKCVRGRILVSYSCCTLLCFALLWGFGWVSSLKDFISYSASTLRLVVFTTGASLIISLAVCFLSRFACVLIRKRILCSGPERLEK